MRIYLTTKPLPASQSSWRQIINKQAMIKAHQGEGTGRTKAQVGKNLVYSIARDTLGKSN